MTETTSPPTTPHTIVSTFQAKEFRPAWWGRQAHIQTIVGSRALQEKFSSSSSAKKPSRWHDIYDRRERWHSPDGDWFHVDFLKARNGAQEGGGVRPMVVALHGLESTSTAVLPRSMAKAFAKNGFDVLVVNFRGCSGEDNHQPFAYHLGFTDDIKFVLRKLHESQPTRRIYLSGFSLGGNVILKCLGELEEEAVDLGVCGAAVACVPFDAVRSSKKIDTGFNRVVYAGNFLSTLKPKAERKWMRYPRAYDIEKVKRVTKIGDFDNEVIAKLHGFVDNVDYYTQSCSKQYLPRIRVPVAVVNAVDDPFIEESGLPSDADCGGAPVRLIYHAYGGHCGFMEEGESPIEEDRWLPNELARFIAHADQPYRSAAPVSST